MKPTHWIDVRAPIEFKAGSVPGALNLPLLTDSERHAVGLVYKEKGQSSAIELGHQLVGGAMRESRTQAWIGAAEQPGSALYCFRGGLRSTTVQSWLNERGVDVPIVSGGFKALRRYLIETLTSLSESLRFEVVCGPTGSGKTSFLHASGRPFLDLEDLARHRGSAFGAGPLPQPTQVDFENQMAVALMRLAPLNQTILVEDESRMIGHRSIPTCLFEKMRMSPRLVLDVPLETRVENILRDYVMDGDQQRFSELRQSVQAISQRLGGLRTQEILVDLQHAESEYREGRGYDSNRHWIRKLLTWYYDPLYSRSPSR